MMIIKKNNIWITFYSLALLTFLGSYAWGITSHLYRSIFCLAVTYIISLIGFFFYFVFSGRNNNTLVQLLAVYLFCAVFYDLSFFSQFTTKPYMLVAELGLLSINAPLAVMLIYLFSDRRTYTRFIKMVKCRFELFVLLFLFVVFSIETLGTITRLDANIYYTSLQDAKFWSLSFDTISLFKIGGHQSLGYAVWGLIGIYLTPNSPVGIRVVYLFMGCVSLVALYAIFKKTLPFKNFQRCILFLAVGLFAFNPLILGIIYDITLDFPTFCFYTWVIYSLLYKKRIYLLFSSLLLVFSKEPGIILLIGSIAGWGIGQLITTYNKYNKAFLKHFDYCTVFVSAVIPLLVMCFTIFCGGVWRLDRILNQNTAESSAVSLQPMDSFGVHPDNTVIKVKEMLFLNFSWVILLFIIVSAFICIFRRRKIVISTKYVLIDCLPIVVSFLLFVSFQFVYITYCHIRYVLPYLLGYLTIFVVLLAFAFSAKKILAILGITCALFLAECFYTLDPVSKSVCDTIDIGETEMYSTRTFVKGSNYMPRTKETHPGLIEYFQMTQSAIYNRQFMYFLNAFEEMLDEIDYDNDTYVAVAPIYESDLASMTWTCLFGRWYSDELFYDMSTHHLTDDESEQSLNVSVIRSNDDIPYENYDRVYLISFPYNKLFDNEAFVSSFDVLNEFTVHKRLWEIYVYQLK